MPFVDPAAWIVERGKFPWKKIRRLSQERLILPDAGPFSIYSSHWTDQLRQQLLQDHSLQQNIPQWRAQNFRKARSLSSNPIDSMLWLDNHTYLPGDLLVKMDIASMHCGLEARSPLLDHELIEFSACLPAYCKVRRGTGKYLLKKLAEKYFPSNFVHRRKMGFGIPQAAWMRNEFQPLLLDVLRDPLCMSPLNPVIVEKTLQKFLNHDDNETTRLWTLFMFGLWRRHGAPASQPA